MKRSILLCLIFISELSFLRAQNGPPPQESASKQLEVRWIYPQERPGIVRKYERLEFGVEPPKEILDRINRFVRDQKEGLNPFDPEQIDLQMELISPSGKKILRYGFFYQDYDQDLQSHGGDVSNYRNEYRPKKTNFPFRIRFAPDEIGSWQVKLQFNVNRKPYGELKDGLNFECIPGNHKGYLTIGDGTSEADRWMYFSETGEPFYAISENLASAGECGYLPSQNKRHLEALDKLITEGGNFARFELGGQSALPDWPAHNNYFGKLDEMHAFDRIVDKCEKNGVYFILFRHHVEVMLREEWADIRWQNNPYLKAFGFKSVEEYFTNEEAIKWQKNCLRYIFSRWGYSPNMAFYGYSEVDNWYYQLSKGIEERKITGQAGLSVDPGKDAESYAAARLRIWISGQQDYIKKTLNDKVKFCHTYASVGKMEGAFATSFFTLSDIVGLHSYGDMKDINYKRRYELLEAYWKKYRKPVFIEEMGPDKIVMFCCTGIEFHNSVWSTAFMGGLGTGMDWWWDRGVFDFDYQKDLGLINAFFYGIDLRKGAFKPQKWSDAGVNKRTIENYSLVSSDGEQALGWVHNATFYWRNLYAMNPCLNNLIEGRSSENEKCYFSKDEHGHPFQKYGTPCPWNHVEVYEHENLSGLDNKSFKDSYTSDGGAVPIVKEKKRSNPKFTLKGLKGTSSFKKHWYRIEFYSTNSSDLIHVKALDRVVHTSSSGAVKIEVPDLDSNNPDYAYKVIYLGRSSKGKMKKIVSGSPLD